MVYRSKKKKKKVGDVVAKATKKNPKKGFLTPLLPKLGDGTQELTKIKRRSKFPLCQNLVMAPTCTHKQQKKRQKKRKEKELGLPLCQKLVMEPTCTEKQKMERKKKQNKKGSLGSTEN
jgi:hypothetical protein